MSRTHTIKLSDEQRRLVRKALAEAIRIAQITVIDADTQGARDAAAAELPHLYEAWHELGERARCHLEEGKPESGRLHPVMEQALAPVLAGMRGKA